MPESGRFEREPRPESVEWLTSVLDSRPGYTTIWRAPHRLIVNRPSGSIVVHLNNIYIVSEADVVEIMAEMPDVDAIVTVSNWNSWTNSARELARSHGKGLFNAKEFLGAVNFSGHSFVNYISPEERKRIEKQSQA